ncbi:hypothetical protein Bca4012_091435 [Brassica carinata]|uniref:F-box associated beta-propeller type 3 domain-containing protein n=1 Tax=Brassica carinata TaxID=52824 RepID=A0A8X7P7U9_BRACI|nr:hypothetical protein Bca52824_085250 [Brassica carinata]
MRLLFTVQLYEEQLLQSCSQDDPSSDRHRLNITPFTRVYAYSPPVRGLICRPMDSKVMVANPSTGQLLTLPRVKTNRRGVLSFLGYDPVNDVYKVLCMTVLQVHQRRGSRVVSEEHQVYTLGVAALISFDLISEEFNVIKVPEDNLCIVNYTGKFPSPNHGSLI